MESASRSTATAFSFSSVLETFSGMKSHFGSSVIKGLFVQNYEKQIFAIWKNDYLKNKLIERK